MYLEKNIMGIFGHGCGHLILALNEEVFSKEGAVILYSGETSYILKMCVFLFLFWYQFMAAIYHRSGSIKHATLALLWMTIHVTLIPGQF